MERYLIFNRQAAVAAATKVVTDGKKKYQDISGF
jgi:hypothetical protein